MSTINMLDPNFNENILIRIWKKVNGNMPEKFAAVVLKYSEERKDIDIAINEWEFHKYLTDGQSKCICSHDISDKYFIKNKHNGNILRTGCDCIEKLSNEKLSESIRIKKAAVNYQKKGGGTNRQCSKCNGFYITIKEDISVIICIRCVNKKKKEEAKLKREEDRKLRAIKEKERILEQIAREEKERLDEEQRIVEEKLLKEERKRKQEIYRLWIEERERNRTRRREEKDEQKEKDRIIQEEKDRILEKERENVRILQKEKNKLIAEERKRERITRKEKEKVLEQEIRIKLKEEQWRKEIIRTSGYSLALEYVRKGQVDRGEIKDVPPVILPKTYRPCFLCGKEKIPTTFFKNITHCMQCYEEESSPKKLPKRRIPTKSQIYLD
jgi:hypothetical protein